MENTMPKLTAAVIRAWNDTTGEIIEHGFINQDDADDEMAFLEIITNNVEIFYRSDWEAGVSMDLNTEYWFGKRETE